MREFRRDNLRTPISPLSNEKKKTSGFLIIGLIAVVALFNPVNLTATPPQEPSLVTQTGTTYSSSAISTTTQLNLTQANVNASRNFQASSLALNSNAGRVSINSTDAAGETVFAVLRLDRSSISQAQTVKYDFEFATSVSTPGASGPNITASVGLTSSNFNGWSTQSRSPVYPNNTKTVSVANIEGSYANGSSRRSLLLEAQQVTDLQAKTSGANSTTLFQREYPGYAAGDGVLHHYSIEIDLQSNRTTWIADETIIASFKLSFIPSTLVFTAAAATLGDSAVATLEKPVQNALLPLLSIVSTPFTVQTTSGVQFQIGNLTNSLGQISSLQNQIDHLNNQVGNLTRQNGQLQAKNSQWFSQWWFSIVTALLGAIIGGSFFVTGVRLRNGRKDIATGSGLASSCPNCGGQMPPEATFCGECGVTLRQTKPVCPGCGGQMPAASVYCGDCGTQIPVEDRVSQNSSHTSTSGSPDPNQDAWR